jgi:prepilin peptidase CpaA
LLAVVSSMIFTSPGFLGSVTGLGVGFLIYFVLHKIAGMGAGDVKLMAVVGAFKGLPFVIFASFYILCIGSILGLLILARREKLFVSLVWVFSTVAGALRPGI